MRLALTLPAFLLFAMTGCGSRPSAVLASHTSLGGDTVARVGNTAIPASLVRDVANAQGITAPDALKLLVDDALGAVGAERAGLDKTPEVSGAIRASLARAVVVAVREEAEKKGPPTDEEVNLVTQMHWAEVDLPEQMRVIHALVRAPSPSTPTKDAEAAALAATMLAAVQKATSDDDFEARAKEVPHGDLEVKIERLDPFVADGRRSQVRGGNFDPEFAKTASSLAVGATSGVVKTPFGWHVIRMIERLPEHRIPFEDRRRIFGEEVRAIRARGALDKLAEGLVAKHPVQIANGVEDMMTETTMSFLGVQRTSEAPAP